MSVILPDQYHLIDLLTKNRVHCITPHNAQSQDIRPLRIGILNIMPNMEGYEFNLLNPLGRNILQIEPVWIRLESHDYQSLHQPGKEDSLEHFDTLYVTFAEAVAEKHLDGLIITGAPVGKIPFEDVKYWEEITSIFEYARQHIPSTLGICWGGIALAYYLGVKRTFYPEKLFGVFQGQNLNRDHAIIGDLDDVFSCPQSRYSRITDEELLAKQEEKVLNLLAYEKTAGYFIFESSDQKFLMHLGHPEYNRARIIEEYERDLKAGLSEVKAPQDFDLQNPKNTWRSHRNEFFSSWIKYVYLNTEFTQTTIPFSTRLEK